MRLVFEFGEDFLRVNKLREILLYVVMIDIKGRKDGKKY